MDAPSAGDLGNYLLALLVGIVSWVFNRDSSRTNKRLDSHDDRLNNHSERLAHIDGKTERE